MPRQAQGSKVRVAALSAGCGDGVNGLPRARGARKPLIGGCKIMAVLPSVLLSLGAQIFAGLKTLLLRSISLLRYTVVSLNI